MRRSANGGRKVRRLIAPITGKARPRHAASGGMPGGQNAFFNAAFSRTNTMPKAPMDTTLSLTVV